MDNRVVISVYGGVAEEIVDLAKGAVQTYIVDFDALEARMADEGDIDEYLSNFPPDVQEWARHTM